MPNELSLKPLAIHALIPKLEANLVHIPFDLLDAPFPEPHPDLVIGRIDWWKSPAPRDVLRV